MELQQDEIVKKKDQTHSKFLSSWIRNQQRKDFSLQKELKSSKKGFMAAIKQVKKSDDSITAIYQSSHVSELKVYYQNFKAWKQECIHRVTMAYYLYKIKDPEICCGLCNELDKVIFPLTKFGNLIEFDERASQDRKRTMKKITFDIWNDGIEQATQPNIDHPFFQGNNFKAYCQFNGMNTDSNSYIFF